jgi:hypothetical protein
MLYVPVIDSLLKNFSLNFKKFMWFGDLEALSAVVV